MITKSHSKHPQSQDMGNTAVYVLNKGKPCNIFSSIIDAVNLFLTDHVLDI